MVKSGIIGAIVSLVLAVIFALLSPVCVPCVALLLGLGVGFLAGVFDKPIESKESVKVGAVAGAVSGIGAALGQMIGAGLNSLIVGPEGVAKMLRQFGLETGGATGVGPGYWVGVFGGGLCFSLVDVVLMAVFGILGALVWNGMLGKKENPYYGLMLVPKWILHNTQNPTSWRLRRCLWTVFCHLQADSQTKVNTRVARLSFSVALQRTSIRPY